MKKNKKNNKINFYQSFGLLFIGIIVIVSLLVFAFMKLFPKPDYYKVTSRVDKVKSTVIDYPEDPLKTVGWIQVQGTNIDYPVVHKETFDSYPGHITGYGWLNNYDPGVHKHIGISGHNIYNLSSKPKLESKYFERFESLMSFVYYDFVKDNKYIQLTMDGKEYVYKIFAVSFLSNDEKLVLPLNEDYNDKELDDYIKLIKKKSIYDFDVDVNQNDKIISVITCTRFYGLTDNKDFRIVGRLIRKNEDITNYSVKRNKNYVQVEEKLKGDDVDVEA